MICSKVSERSGAFLHALNEFLRKLGESLWGNAEGAQTFEGERHVAPDTPSRLRAFRFGGYLEASQKLHGLLAIRHSKQDQTTVRDVGIPAQNTALDLFSLRDG
jgi:hypothetical protein